MFRKILIANRGEIACRVIRTARKLGVATVAVYSDADARALHVASADEAIGIGPAPASESYLRGDKIIAAALATGSDAIHPGYGFLSENPDFIEQVDAAGLRFIGPSADSVRAMGLKDAAKKLMEDAGVPVVPGYHGDNQDADFLAEQAQQIGYPVLIKARAGGGGKGMRRVDSAADFASALEGAQREGQASFGDAHCLVEKYVASPRHIEIQVFGDDHGNVVHLFERDCSLQRRHQKVIEEAPAPGMTNEMREAMGGAAVRAAQSINYSGAGTVEFIVDGSDGLLPDRFWFMEMNTRLQVEHPVTECISGQDLVEWQLRVAAGEVLPRRQQELSINGWAFESRIYAEDAGKGFLPATGTLKHLQFATAARTDTGVAQGDTISPHYDPMIAKLIVHGSSRAVALNKMAASLQATSISGTVTNIDFLHALCHHAGFASGEVDTGLIERDLDQLVSTALADDSVLALASLGAMGLQQSAAPRQGFSLWQPLAWQCRLQQGDQLIETRVAVEAGGRFAVQVGDNAISIEQIDADAGIYLIDGKRTRARIVSVEHQVSVFCDRAHHFTVVDPLAAAAHDQQGGDVVTAPMSGLVKLVSAETGAKVSEGDAIVVMEAMKMEHTLRAPRDGVLGELPVGAGDQVDEGDLIFNMESEQD